MRNWIKIVSLFVFALLLMLPFRMTAQGASSDKLELTNIDEVIFTPDEDAFETVSLVAITDDDKNEVKLRMQFVLDDDFLVEGAVGYQSVKHN